MLEDANMILCFLKLSPHNKACRLMCSVKIIIQIDSLFLTMHNNAHQGSPFGVLLWKLLCHVVSIIWFWWQYHWFSVLENLVISSGALFLAATKQLYEWYFLSVCPSVRLSVRLSVCPSVRLSHLFNYVPIIVSSWNFQELSHWTRVRSMQKVKVRGQRSRSQRSRPKFSFPDCNSSLNSHMMIKLYI